MFKINGGTFAPPFNHFLGLGGLFPLSGPEGFPVLLGPLGGAGLDGGFGLFAIWLIV
jgi:hypothetical protein